jgi:hypothetical protein
MRFLEIYCFGIVIIRQQFDKLSKKNFQKYLRNSKVTYTFG